MDRQEACQEAAQTIIDARIAAMDKAGITHARLICDLKKELRATETKFIKVKRGLGDSAVKAIKRELEKNHGLTGKPGRPRKGAYRVIYETGDEVLLAVEVEALGIRQAARKDAHELRNDYPPKRQELTGAGGGPIKGEVTVKVVYDDKPIPDEEDHDK